MMAGACMADSAPGALLRAGAIDCRVAFQEERLRDPGTLPCRMSVVRGASLPHFGSGMTAPTDGIDHQRLTEAKVSSENTIIRRPHRGLRKGHFRPSQAAPDVAVHPCLNGDGCIFKMGSKSMDAPPENCGPVG